MCWVGGGQVLMKKSVKNVLYQESPGVLEYSRYPGECETFQAFFTQIGHKLMSPCAQKRQTNVCMCSNDIYASRVTSISQMLPACTQAQGLPWQGSLLHFQTEFSDFQKSALLDVNGGLDTRAWLGPFLLKPWKLVFSLSKLSGLYPTES